MKYIVYVFLAVLLCLICVGGVSAFQIEDEAVINPSGVLGTGETVTADMVLKFSAGAMEMGNDLILTTELVNPIWTTTVISGGHEITSRNNTNRENTISGYLIGYQQGVLLDIHLEGSVSTASAGTSICVLRIDQGEYGTNELGTFSTPLQYVYNTADLDSDIASENSKIAGLESKISKYNSYSADFTSAKQFIASAKTALSNAKSSGTSDFRNAITSLTKAQSDVSQAEKSVYRAILDLINININEVDKKVSNLQAEGMTAEASLLNSANQGVKISYDAAVNTLSSGGTPSVDNIFADSVNVINIAKSYLSETPVQTSTSTPKTTQSSAVTAAATTTLTAVPSAGVTYVQNEPNEDTISISLPSLFGSSEEIISVGTIIILILCVIIVINVLVIKHLLKKNKGNRGKRGKGKKSRDSDEL